MLHFLLLFQSSLIIWRKIIRISFKVNIKHISFIMINIKIYMFFLLNYKVKCRRQNPSTEIIQILNLIFRRNFNFNILIKKINNQIFGYSNIYKIKIKKFIKCRFFCVFILNSKKWKLLF